MTFTRSASPATTLSRAWVVAADGKVTEKLEADAPMFPASCENDDPPSVESQICCCATVNQSACGSVQVTVHSSPPASRNAPVGPPTTIDGPSPGGTVPPMLFCVSVPPAPAEPKESS